MSTPTKRLTVPLQNPLCMSIPQESATNPFTTMVNLTMSLVDLGLSSALRQHQPGWWGSRALGPSYVQDLGSASLGCSRKPGKFDSCHSSMVWMRTVNYNYAGRCQLHTGASFPATVSGKISGSEDKQHTHTQIHTLRKFGLRILT